MWKEWLGISVTEPWQDCEWLVSLRIRKLSLYIVTFNKWIREDCKKLSDSKSQVSLSVLFVFMANVKGQVHRPFRVGLSDAGVMDGASNSAKVARALVSSHSRVSARSWVEYVYWCNAVSLACLFLFVVAFKNHLHVHLISHVLLRGPVVILKLQKTVRWFTEGSSANQRCNKTAGVWAASVANLPTLYYFPVV